MHDCDLFLAYSTNSSDALLNDGCLWAAVDTVNLIDYALSGHWFQPYTGFNQGYSVLRLKKMNQNILVGL